MDRIREHGGRGPRAVVTARSDDGARYRMLSLRQHRGLRVVVLPPPTIDDAPDLALTPTLATPAEHLKHIVLRLGHLVRAEGQNEQEGEGKVEEREEEVDGQG